MTLIDLQKTIGVNFRSDHLLKQAFVHRSYLNESKEFKDSNERLEFLGDAVLELSTSQFLYAAYPEFPEGILTNIRSALVKTESLASVAKKLDLGALLLLSRGEEASGGRANQSLLADAFEALLGALYLDQGLVSVDTLLKKLLFPNASKIVENKAFLDYKSWLQEIVQEKNRISPIYKVIKSEGPDHAKIFWVQARVNETVLGNGSGRSKQEAEQAAAKESLEKMGKLR